MNHRSALNDDSIIPYFSLPFPAGFEVCWAGSNPLESGFCFGSLDGRLLFTDEIGHPFRQPGKGSAAQEAINGVTCVDSWIGVSTREEVSFWPLPETKGGDAVGLVLPFGAHNITRTRGGYFIAPMGRNGILAVKPPFDPALPMIAHAPATDAFYAYHVTALHSEAFGDVLACACRTRGITSGAFSGGKQASKLMTAAFDNLDMIDVCPLGGCSGLAVAALSADGTIILFKDILHDKHPIAQKFESMQGVAYRIVSSRGDIYVLTSTGLYMLGKLAVRFLDGALLAETITPVLCIPMEAADIALSNDRWLLAIQETEVLRLDVEFIHNATPNYPDSQQSLVYATNPKLREDALRAPTELNPVAA